MNENNVKKMKELLEQKKKSSQKQPKHRPTQKIGSGSTAFDSTKSGGSNNKI